MPLPQARITSASEPLSQKSEFGDLSQPQIPEFSLKRNLERLENDDGDKSDSPIATHNGTLTAADSASASASANTAARSAINRAVG